MSNEESLYQRACRSIPGGVNSPVRAFRAVGGEPVFIARAAGAYLYGADGREFIDYVGSWGPMILGHAHPAVVRAVQEAVARGLSYGAPTEAETRLAEELCRRVPSMEQVRLVSSGTEATMSAIRLARGYTGRDKLVKFEGCYHGHADGLLVKAGSGALTFGVPTSAGVPAATAADTVTLRYNRLAEVERAFDSLGEEVACLIVEPVAGNMSCVPPLEGFLEGLRQLCDRHGALLIFDEVLTGFRVSPGGAQERYGVRPDLTTLGKIIGGGMPVGAFGGRREIMQQLAPVGPVYQAGTLSGNPLAMAAGLATLAELERAGVYEQLERTTSALCRGLEEAAGEAGIELVTEHVGAMFGLYFSRQRPVRYYEQVCACDVGRFRRFFHQMLEAGIYLAPSAFEAGFLSTAHGERELDRTLEAARHTLRRL